MTDEEMIEEQNAYYMAGYPSRRSERKMSDLEVVNDAKNKAIRRAEIAEKRIAELEAQIEKMKCCGNCNGILDGGRRAEKCRHCMDSKELSEWELEN